MRFDLQEKVPQMIENHSKSSRRSVLKSLNAGLSLGLGSGALLNANESYGLDALPNFIPKAKHVIFMFMSGGPSQMDTFDYKPKLNQDDGKMYHKKKLMGSPFKFKRYGESGLWISELFPHLAKRADDLCFVKSLHTDSPGHTRAVPFFQTGSLSEVRPSMGSWVNYGLQHQNINIPGFVTLKPSRMYGGPANFGSAFLPSIHQGTRLGWEGQAMKQVQFENAKNDLFDREVQIQQLALLQKMNRTLLATHKDEQSVIGETDSFMLGQRMQTVMPEIMNLDSESKSTKSRYGIDQKITDDYGRQCLMARRFVEAGVKFIQLNVEGWDHHHKVKDKLPGKCASVDQPIAALIEDLKQRGLFDETLIVWSGEFGRLPQAENGTGRNHNPKTSTAFMAGGGVKGGFSYGESDDYAHHAVTNRVHVHDFHATILSLLGINHEKLTYRYGGRDYRLTDLHGNIIHNLIA